MSWLSRFAALAILASPVQAADGFGENTKAAAQRFLAILKTECPVAGTDSQEAFDHCRKALFASKDIEELFAPRVTWGGFDDTLPAWRQKNTTFDSKLWTSLYLPLMMFDGEYELKHDGISYWSHLHARAAFRGRLQPGQFPYPFWHAPAKWAAYDKMNELVFRFDPVTSKIVAIFRIQNPERGPLVAESVTPHVFDGKWMWKDSDGKLQPAATLYDGLFDRNNPFKLAMDSAYKNFATELRDQSCLSCHTPTNPQKMSTLILLQTPAHAAGEIKRLIAAVEAGEMPIEEWGSAAPLGAQAKAAFLAKARAFEEASSRAFDWERARQAQ